MAEDWSIDVKKYVPNADDTVIAAIVRHCGIALQSRDASLVAFTDPAELNLVRESWLKKKLGLTDPDTVLDAAIAKVGDTMKADHTKNRVTVYYLLADAFGKLGLLGGVAPVAAAAVAAAPVAAAPVAAAPVAAAVRAPVAAAPVVAESGGGFGRLALLGLLALGAAGLIWWWLHRPAEPAAPVVAETAVTETTTTETTTAAVAAPAIPTGAGVTEQEVDGKPKVSVYFDTAKTDVSPDFATVAAPVKAYVDAHPGTVLGISGFNDPRGDAAFNAELSKNRAKSVRAALVVIGVPETATDLVKPSETTDTEDALAEGRRVDIYVKE